MCEIERIKLKKLYSVPKIFDEISFHDGLNIILGEKVEDNSNRKTNGVGKSVCVEFINFCLLKDYDDTRLSKISPSDIDYNTYILLDLLIGFNNITIKRQISSYNTIEINVNEETYKFNKINDAKSFLETLIFGKKNSISYRQLISCVTREEKIDYSNIFSYYGSKKIPDDPTALLFMLGLEKEKINSVSKVQKQFTTKNEAKNEAKKNLEKLSNLSLKEIKSSINEKEIILKNLLLDVRKIQTDDIYKSIENELVKIESELKQLRTDRILLKNKISQIEGLPKPEIINSKDLKNTYNYFKDGLGDYIEKSLDEVISFKNIVEKYQQTLVNEKLKKYREDLNIIENKIRLIQSEYDKKLDSINFENKSGIDYITNGVKNIVSLQNEVNDTKALFNLYNKLDLEVKELKTEYTVKLNELNKNLAEVNETIDSLEKTIVEFHKYVMNDGHCSFSISLDDKISTKKLVNVDLRITDDGSYSVDRIKMFLFDIALMIDDKTRKRHPKFLIHDNIFQMDNDSLEKCISLILEKEQEFSDFQYITTLNIDDIEKTSINSIINSDKYIVAKFTKNNKFLKIDYKELGS